MKSIIRNVLAVVGGIIVGGAVNMGLVMLGSAVVPPPQGVDVTDMESIASSIHLFEIQHFLFPFLAHAFGSLTGGMTAALVGTTRHIVLALIVGGIFLLGGLINVVMIPGPVWFAVLDILVAYLPMAWLGGRLGVHLLGRS